MASTTENNTPSTSFLESQTGRSWARKYLQQPAPAFGSMERRNALQELPALSEEDDSDLHTQQQRAILAPIRCLPLELLSEVFELLTHGAYFPDTSLQLLTLAFVSTHWRNIAHSNACLWTSVKLYEGYARPSLQLAATPAALVRWLANTKMVPLEILLSSPGRDEKLMWDAISPHMGHVKTLEVSLRSLSPAQRAGMFMDLDAEDAPLLHTLRIEGFDDVQFSPGIIEEIHAVPKLTQIESLTLKNLVIPLKLLFACQNLRSLKIDHCIDSPQTGDSEHTDTAQLEHYLPLLEALEISRDHTTHMTASVSLYHIFAQSPNLQNVTCGWYCQFIPLVFGATDITRLNIEYDTGVGRPRLVRKNVVALFQELEELEEVSISVLELGYHGPDTMGDATVVLEVLAEGFCPFLRRIKFECVTLNRKLLLRFSKLRGGKGMPVQCRVTTVDCLGVPDVTDALYAELKEALRQVETESDAALAIPVTTP